MRHLLFLTVTLIASTILQAQAPHLDVEGNARVRGKLDIIVADGDSSVFIGANAGINDDRTQNQNTFVGTNAGRFNTTGRFNSFFGASSGINNTRGVFNSFFGRFSGFSNTEGEFNSFFGGVSGSNNTTGDDNSFFGVSSGNKNTTGESNSFFGRFSGFNNTYGYSNSFFGRSSGNNNTSGFGNSFFGRSSGSEENNTRSTMLGYDAQTLDSLDRAIAIGYNAKVDCHNCAVIGGTGADAVKVGIGTTTPDEALHVEGNARVRGRLDIIVADGDSSVFIGANAGINDDATQNQNTFVGTNAGRFNTTGRFNSFFGRSSGIGNTTGGDNSFFGANSGFYNTTGASNSFFGRNSGFNNRIGGDNSFFGRSSGFRNTTGASNSFFGRGSGFDNTTGGNNSFFGESAGSEHNNTRSTMLGYDAETLDSLDRAIAIGYNAQVDCDNCAVIGGTGEDAVKVGIGTTTPDEALHVVGDIRLDSMLILNGYDSEYGVGDDDAVIFGAPEKSGGDLILVSRDLVAVHIDQDLSGVGDFKINKGTSFNETLLTLDNVGNLTIDGCYKSGSTTIGGTCLSDITFKKDITHLDSQLPLLMNLRPVTYNWKESVPDQNRAEEIGLIAQEVEAVIPEMVDTDADGIKRIKYDLALQIRMIKAIQEQQVIIEDQALRLEQQQKENHGQDQIIIEMRSELDELKKLMVELKTIHKTAHPGR